MNLPVVLIADKLAESTVAALGDQVEVRWVDGPDREKLLAAVPEADALLVRSATTVDAEVLAAAPKLKIVARAGVGLDNVDVDAATERGVLVVNAPTSNIHSAAEHAIALLLAASRQIAAADATLREHTWKRSSFSGTEIFGKTVGVVGLGRIGQLVAQRLAAFGAHIVAYDPYVSPARAAQLGIELLSLDDLLARADFISVHLPKTPETAGLIDKEALAKTKPGVIIVNAARGGLVDEAALAEAVSSGHVRAAGLDVFSTEPCTDSPLFELPQVVVTPHLGASTAEAQDRAGTDVAESVRLALAGEFVPDAVNVGGGVVNEEVAPWLDLARKLGVLAAALSDGPPVSLSVQVRGELAAEDVEVLKLSALRGLFSAVVEGPVTFVNAPALAAERGVTAEITTASESPNYRSVVDVRAVAARRFGRQRRRHAVRAAAGGKDRADQRPPLRPARRRHQPDHPLRRPAGSAGQDRHLAGRRRGEHPRGTAVRGRRGPVARRFCCGWTRTCPTMCGRRSRRRWAPTSSKWLICRETGGYRGRRDRAGGGRRGRQSPRHRAAGRARRPATTWGPGGFTPPARCCRTRWCPNCASTTRSCWARSVIRRCPAACWSEVCCCACASSWITTSTCDRRGCTRAWKAPWRGAPQIDFVVVREGTEGPYTGNGGAIRVGTPHEVATEVSLNTAFGVRRVVADAFERAQRRRKHLTLVHKNNVLTFAGSLWSRIVAEVGEKYPDVEVAYHTSTPPPSTWSPTPAAST